MDLDSMKYAELRGLAKELGLKANMKADKLLKAIKQLYEKQKQEDGKVPEKEAINVEEEKKATVDTDGGEVEALSLRTSRVMFVNTRRGKGTRTKRKISDTETVAKAETEVAEVGAVCGTADTKRRRVSSTRDTDQTEADLLQETPSTGSEQQPDEKDEAPVPCNTDAPKVAKGGRIPRLHKKSKPSLNPVTPNFKKLHEAHFNKMESIDTYFQRKTKQIESHRTAVKEVKMLSDKTKLKQTSGKVQVENPGTSMFSPASTVSVEDKRRHTAVFNKSAVKEDAAFRPSVLSTRRINVRFSQATRDNEKNKISVKTPIRMSACAASSTPKTQTSNAGKPNDVKISTLSATKTPGAFVFSGNPNDTITPGTQKKPNFDLKASLSRPLGYKPHKGKLKAFGEPKENTAVNQSVVSNSHQKNYKQHQVQTRENRRTKHTEDRKQKKENLLGARRGLVMM
ncbi:nucleolar and spindle-associated protein 1 [Genypterus blacodes]|uniref:nucleolar and spindle-associated protein 1 n=1 Tax=Genypterus blacodes TaxID=154954 RepID=UPI003F76ED25